MTKPQELVERVDTLFSDLRKAQKRWKDPDRFDDVCTATFWKRFTELFASALQASVQERERLRGLLEEALSEAEVRGLHLPAIRHALNLYRKPIEQPTTPEPEPPR